MKIGRPLLPLPLLAGCSGVQTMTDAAGVQSSLFNSLFTIFLVVTCIFYVLVIAFLLWAMIRRSGTREDGLPGSGESPNKAVLTTALVVWVAVIGVTLFGLTIGSYFADRGLAQVGAKGVPVRIRITAEQWWWRIEYLDPTESNVFQTANELHLPVNTPVKIELVSNDVIHSFWVPNIAGKQDLIPGRTNDITLIPTRLGHFRGQCAEYCGTQHAHMALDVFVHPKGDYLKWRIAQLTPPAPPTDPLALAGQAFFITHQCSGCHSIAGTDAFGKVAPDLTHFASRTSIAAGTLPNTPGNLYGWVQDPQGAKPGNHMPTIGLEPRDLDGVVAYLETLK